MPLSIWGSHSLSGQLCTPWHFGIDAAPLTLKTDWLSYEVIVWGRYGMKPVESVESIWNWKAEEMPYDMDLELRQAGLGHLRF